jgi:hypothetical protein
MPDNADLNSLPKHGEGPTVLSDGLSMTNPEARKELDASFDDFFAEEDAKEKEAPPSAPGAIKLATKPEIDEQPAAEPEVKHVEERERSTRPSSRPPEVEEAPVAEPVAHDEPDTEIDGLELDRGASPAQKSQFKELKAITKRF